MKILIKENINDKIKIELEEYIPFKIKFIGKEEPINYFSYSKEKKSMLEIAIGSNSGLIRRITLLICEKYEIYDDTLCLEKIKCEEGEIEIEEYRSMECENFITHLFCNGIRVLLSYKETVRYIKKEALFIGLSNENEITEICVTKLTEKEISHIKTELEHQ